MHRRTLTWAVLAALPALPAAILPQAAHADVTLHIQDVSIQSDPSIPVTGSFNVYANVTGASPQLAGYQVVLNLAPASGAVTFQSIGNTQVGEGFSPVFPGNVPQIISNNGFHLSLDNLLDSGTTALDNWEGLVRVNFQVSPGVSGIFHASFDLTPNIGTLMVDGNGDPIAFNAGGQNAIDVNIPEPASGLLFLAAMLLPAMAGDRNKR